MFAQEPPGIVNQEHFDALEGARTVYLTDADYDVFGDGKVVIKSAPGHTPGHIVLFIDLEEIGLVLLSGDLYHYPEERGRDKFPASRPIANSPERPGKRSRPSSRNPAHSSGSSTTSQTTTLFARLPNIINRL